MTDVGILAYGSLIGNPALRSSRSSADELNAAPHFELSLPAQARAVRERQLLCLTIMVLRSRQKSLPSI